MFIPRKFDPDKDSKAAHRIWREIGWIDSKSDEKCLDVFLQEGNGFVATVDGEAECLVTSKPATLQYQNEVLNLSVITSVGTSRIARKQGFAKRLTAMQIAQDSESGALVSTLGIFEQGFYNQLGYGSGSYEHWITFDPADLLVKGNVLIPRRLSKKDWKLVHGALQNRQKDHGSCTLLPACVVEAELGWGENGFGLGYMNEDHKELTHFFWGNMVGENGPFTIRSMAYQNFNQFMDLMGLIKSLGDQIHLVKMREPAGIQMQDLIQNPFRSRVATEKSKFEHINRASSYWQVRICDLQGCMAATHLNVKPFRFNLQLSDPIEAHLDPNSGWKGCAGNYILTIGPESKAMEGFEEELPVLKSDIGAFTRLWLGVQPASGLAATDNLSGPTSLLDELDQAFCLPIPHTGWDY